MITLIAIGTLDGYGYIKSDENIFLVRPPYFELEESSEDNVIVSVCKYGLDECYSTLTVVSSKYPQYAF